MENKLVENLNRLSDFARESFEPIECPMCGRIIEEKEDAEFTKEYGHCLMCDSELDAEERDLVSEVYEQDYPEDNDGLPERRFY